jgi:hypothetical protein
MAKRSDNVLCGPMKERTPATIGRNSFVVAEKVAMQNEDTASVPNRQGGI